MGLLNTTLPHNCRKSPNSPIYENENHKVFLVNSPDEIVSQPNDQIIIRTLISSDIPGVKKLADQNRDALGFLPLAKLIEVERDNRALVASKNNTIIGFVLFRHRKIDLQTTLSDICISEDYRNQGIGRMLVDALLIDCGNKLRDFIQLKCPIDLPANIFYERLGFSLHTIEDGKKRQLKVWRLLVSSVKGDGN
jgi:ribosomal protein S18 acetylase RimI-like enzyme